MYKYLLIFLFLTFTACSTSAQSTDKHHLVQPTILIDASGEFRAPADLIWFQINLNRFDKDAEKAFDEHKQLERFLTDLLLEQGLNHDHINANPISISPRRHTNDQGFETNQRVSIKLTDITQFETMQILLIKNGFDNFSGNFSTSMQKEAREKALEDAVAGARRSAEILAGASGMTVGEVVGIEYTSSYGPVYRDAMALSVSAPSDGGMLQFQSTITVQENIRMRFSLID